MSTSVAQFVPLVTFLDSSFWNEFNLRKLNDWKLDNSPKPIVGSFNIGDSDMSISRLSVSYDAFDTEKITDPIISANSIVRMNGYVVPLNTVEEFKSFCRKSLVENFSSKIKNPIETKEWLNNPSLLNTFTLFVFADLKRFRYNYWNCVPVLTFPHDIQFSDVKYGLDPEVFAIISEKMVVSNYSAFLLLKRICAPLTVLADTQCSSDDICIVFPDSSTTINAPGWTMRNILAAVAHLRPDWNSARFIAFRSGKSVLPLSLCAHWRRESCDWENMGVVGWERNSDGRLAPCSVDLRETFDYGKLLEQSVELNLRLIRWRLVPDLQLDRFTNLKCLILGSGTLGCNIARSLLGWGVRFFTFVDCATVSYSNPVRQSLFNFLDSISGDKSKAVAAADSLRRIYPSVVAEGINMTIPMPGHTYSSDEENQIILRMESLQTLIRDHDVVFIVMDSREARWLPTLLSAFHNKLAFSVALGFDSYLVIRHGMRFFNRSSTVDGAYSSDCMSIPGSELGCYFCSDVTAPGNSSRDRTLDQQCTVSRAGISFAASGMAVELLASVLQHPEMGCAPAQNGESDDAVSVLGATPHQIRAYISKFCQMTPSVRRFEKCVACGDAVLSSFNEDKFSFLFRAINEPSYLERICGLDKLHSSAAQLEIWDYDDNSSVSST